MRSLLTVGLAASFLLLAACKGGGGPSDQITGVNGSASNANGGTANDDDSDNLDPNDSSGSGSSSSGGGSGSTDEPPSKKPLPIDGGAPTKHSVDPSKLGAQCGGPDDEPCPEGEGCFSFSGVDPTLSSPRCVESATGNPCGIVTCAPGTACGALESEPAQVRCD